MSAGTRKDESSSKRSSAVVVVALLAMAVLTSAGGCRQIVGIEPREAVEACLGVAHASVACGACTEEACCSELSTCAGEPACAAAYACLEACDPTDDACRSLCGNDRRDGFGVALTAVRSCQTGSCTTACSASCGRPVTSSSECTVCLTQKCCAEARACEGSAACMTRRLCSDRCRDRSCRSLCGERDVDGADAEEALRSCEARSCQAACTAWQCVGAAPSAATRIVITLQIVDSVTTSPVAGLEVRRCPRLDATCTTGSAIQPTNGSGVAQFDLGIDGAFDDYFEVRDPKGERIPVLAFFAPSLINDATLLFSSFTKRAREQILAGFGTPPKQGRGDVLVRPLDCRRDEAAGVRFALSPGIDDATEFYLDRRLPLRFSEQVHGTDGLLAFGGFLGVHPGTYRLSGKAVLLATPLDLFATSVFVRSDAITVVDYAATR